MSSPFSTIGFIGTGAITEAMVRGLLAEPAATARIVVSARNAQTAARLAADFPAVEIAADNQAIVDAADLVILAIRPQIAEEVVRPLVFRAGQAVISLVAAVDRERVADWIGAPVNLTQAIPLPFVARRIGVTAIFPPDPLAERLFGILGTPVPCASREEYQLLAAASAMMATYFGIMDETVRWLGAKGMPDEAARTYVTALFADLSVSARDTDLPSFAELSHEYATKGGLNEQVHDDFRRHGGASAITSALERVLARIEGKPF
ncbi:pyrroline-5-carboxylate reductase [Rhizobium sp. RU20A]|uniref:pyrroline-5-carboxylate reductase n=1 Tax=Rhizobium sp. RU20A TaxID=1907412 RepID=UPI0009553276|nr:pyrroline-5-carboxylate reductase [Rhizobium sp. RU20A]SIR14399.1 pyrroline-5-carboxylate reductase [Rhizobium sp. RU20A]